MAINPVLAQDETTGQLFPLCESGENMILRREDIHFKCTLPRGGKLTGHGCFFFSTTRIVFVVEKKKSSRADFTSFEIPLVKLQEPKFEQPIFGANYLRGLTREPREPDSNEPSPLSGGPTAWSLTFNSGGCGTFLPLFFQRYQEVMQSQMSSQLTRAIVGGNLQNVAYIDPSDPSTLYISQPSAAANSEQRTSFDMEDNNVSNNGSNNPNNLQGNNQNGCVCC